MTTGVTVGVYDLAMNSANKSSCGSTLHALAFSVIALIFSSCAISDWLDEAPVLSGLCVTSSCSDSYVWSFCRSRFSSSMSVVSDDGLDNDNLYVSVVDDSELLSDDGDTLKFAEGLSENTILNAGFKCV